MFKSQISNLAPTEYVEDLYKVLNIVGLGCFYLEVIFSCVCSTSVPNVYVTSFNPSQVCACSGLTW